MMMPQLALLMVVGAINSLCTPQSDDVVINCHSEYLKLNLILVSVISQL